jgi:50S ribosomal protein L16 3-hydroxylase
VKPVDSQRQLLRRQLLGGLTASTFLRRYWQKQPLLVRNAIPGFSGVLDIDRMFELAGREDCESRLVLREGTRWHVEHGPFRPALRRRLPARNWTLLVQGVDLLLPQARTLLSRFDFIPHARLDDLMVSYAPPGGGVGPHFDSYDVFLLQGPGRRRWRVGRQADLSLVEDAPLKILSRFAPEGECLLEAGDMLYLPPALAHEGDAVSACYTYSIGFRAPSHGELMEQFLVYLEERVSAQGRYRDPDLRLQAHPARISASMISKVERVLDRIDWRRRDVADFLGRYLTEPKIQVSFSPPHRPLSAAAFLRAARRSGVRLAPASQMLYTGSRLYINGEHAAIDAGAAPELKTLANARALPGSGIAARGAAIGLLYDWYRAGYISLASANPDSRRLNP